MHSSLLRLDHFDTKTLYPILAYLEWPDFKSLLQTNQKLRQCTLEIFTVLHQLSQSLPLSVYTRFCLLDPTLSLNLQRVKQTLARVLPQFAKPCQRLTEMVFSSAFERALLEKDFLVLTHFFKDPKMGSLKFSNAQLQDILRTVENILRYPGYCLKAYAPQLLHALLKNHSHFDSSLVIEAIRLIARLASEDSAIDLKEFATYLVHKKYLVTPLWQEHLPPEIWPNSILPYLDSLSCNAFKLVNKQLHQQISASFASINEIFQSHVTEDFKKADFSLCKAKPDAVSALVPLLVSFYQKNCFEHDFDFYKWEKHCSASVIIQPSDYLGLRLLAHVQLGDIEIVHQLLQDLNLNAVWINLALAESIRKEAFKVFHLLIEDPRINAFAFDHLSFRILQSMANDYYDLLSQNTIELLEVAALGEAFRKYIDKLDAKTGNFYSTCFANHMHDTNIWITSDVLTNLSAKQLSSFLVLCETTLNENIDQYGENLVGLVLMRLEQSGRVPSAWVKQSILLILKQMGDFHGLLEIDENRRAMAMHVLNQLLYYFKVYDPLSYYTFYEEHARTHRDCLEKAAKVMILYLQDEETQTSSLTFEFFISLLKELILSDRSTFYNFDEKLQTYYLQQSHKHNHILMQPIEDHFLFACEIFIEFQNRFCSKSTDIRLHLLHELLKDPRLDPQVYAYPILKLACEKNDLLILQMILSYVPFKVSIEYDELFQLALKNDHIEIVLELFERAPHSISLLSRTYNKAVNAKNILERNPFIFREFHKLILLAIEAGKIEVVKAILSIYPEIPLNEAFYLSVIENQFEIATFLLKQKRSKPFKYHSYAALGWALYYGQKDFFDALIQEFRIDRRKKACQSFIEAKEKGPIAALQLLLKMTHISLLVKRPVLIWAIDHRLAEAVKMILSRIPPIYDQDQVLALQSAASYAEDTARLVIAELIQTKLKNISK